MNQGAEVCPATKVDVTAQTAYPPRAASPRVRLDSWRPFLRPLGVRLRYEPALTDAEYAILTSAGLPSRKLMTLVRSAARLARAAAGDGLVLVHRLRFPAPLPWIDGRRLDVYDFDDAIYLGSMLPSNRRFAWVKREAERSVDCMRRARLVIAGSPYLADYARGQNRHVEIVPSCVDTDRIRTREHADSDAPTIGWLGSASTSQYLDGFLPFWSKFRAAHFKRARLLLVGADPSIRGPGIEHRAWSLEAERAALREFDIGIMPLPDGPWTRGKCGYKLLQYYAAGVPAIGAPIGINATLLAGGGGVAASSGQQWISHLRELASSKALRAEIGDAGRSFVEREYSYSAWAGSLAALLKSV